MNTQALRIGTRGSALALAQSGQVAERLRSLHRGLSVELITMKTEADLSPHIPLAVIGDKGLWVSDLEQRLTEGAIDVAVHSMKDVPADLADGLVLGPIPERECPFDVLVLPASDLPRRFADPAFAAAPGSYPEIQEVLNDSLPRRARVGTSSSRRSGQLLEWRRDLQVIPIRGNVDTRLRKLDTGEYDALVLAAAGMIRLRRADRISVIFPPRRMVPAAGQGVLALEIRESDHHIAELLQPLHHGPTAAALAAERAFIRSVGGGCSVPLGAHAVFEDKELTLSVHAAATHPADSEVIHHRATVGIPAEAPFDDLRWAVELGRSTGAAFLERGGSEFIARLQAASS